MADVEQLIHMTSGLVDGVTRLREIVLHAAVHGTLVSQDPSDEPADLLLARSRAAVVRQTQAGRAKREKPAADLEPAEQHFELPTGWSWARIVDTGQYINGLAFKPSDWKSKGRPIIRIQNLSGRNPEFNYTDGTFDPSVVVHDGDILVSWSATLDAFIWRGVEGVLNQHIFRVVPAPLVDKAYLFWLLKWVIRRMAASDHVHGLVMGHINRGPFLAFPVPIPPLAEQKRIVAKVDELMALCDRLEAQLRERDARSADLSKAALAKFSEESTVENLEYLFHPSFAVTASQLRTVIRSSAVRGRLVPSTTAPCPSDGEAGHTLGYEIPRHWRWTTLEAVVSAGPTNGVSPKSVDHPTGVKSLSLGATTSGKFKSSHFKHIDICVPDHSDLWLQDGDLLVQRSNSIDHVGISAIYRGPERTFIYPDLMMRVRVSAVIDVSFLHLVMLEAAARDYLRSRATGTSGSMPKINQQTLRQLPVPLPPLAEQRRIVAKVEELMALVDQLEAQVAASDEAGTKLLDALVAELAPSN
jgi:type I restriction enzyme, S subunit